MSYLQTTTIYQSNGRKTGKDTVQWPSRTAPFVSFYYPQSPPKSRSAREWYRERHSDHAYAVDTQRRTYPLDVDASLLQRDWSLCRITRLASLGRLMASWIRRYDGTERRTSMTAWLALVISFLALGFSVFQDSTRRGWIRRWVDS